MRHSFEKNLAPYRPANGLSLTKNLIETHLDIPESQTPKWKQMLRWVKELPVAIQTTLDNYLYEKRETSPTTKKEYYEAILEQGFQLTSDPITVLSPSNNPQYEKFILKQKNSLQDLSTLETQNTKPQRALVFVPHADDIAYSMGGLMTELKNKYGDKLAFDFVIATDGTAGFSPDDQKKYSSTERKKIRQHEQIREAITLGADSIAFLHYADSHLEDHTQNAETDLVREIQLTHPTYVFSYGPRYEQKNTNKNILSTNIEHVDHIASGKITGNAIKKSGMRASVPNQKNPLRQPHRPKFWFQFGYDHSVSQQTNYAYQLTNKTFVQKLSAFATNKSQTMINWELSAEINALHYLIRVNREVDGNNSSLSENFVVQTIPRMS